MLVSGWNTHFCQTLTSVQSTLHSSQKSFLCCWFFHLIPFFTTSLIAFNHFLLRHMSPFPAKMKLLHWSNIMFKELKRCQVAHPHTALCVQGSVPELFSFSSLFLMMPYSIALSRQFWAIFETASGMPSPPFARTERISRASLSMSFSARLFSAWIMFWTMTTPRWRRSGISLSNKACTISSQWVVWEDNRSHVSKNRVKKNKIMVATLLECFSYSSRDASAEFRMFGCQHGQGSCSSFPQPPVILSAIKHEQLQAIISCGQVELLHLRMPHSTAATVSSTGIHVFKDLLINYPLPQYLKPSCTCTLWQKLVQGHAPQTCNLQF